MIYLYYFAVWKCCPIILQHSIISYTVHVRINVCMKHIYEVVDDPSLNSKKLKG